MLVHGTANHRHADLFGNLVAHLRQARARHQKRHAHLRGLDDHFAGEPARGVENFVATVDAVQPHHPGNGVHRVVAPHVFYEIEQFATRVAVGRQCTAMHRTRLLVNGFVLANLLGQCVQCALF